MFLSQLVQKQIHTNAIPRGVCLGVGISLKTYAVRYLLCSSDLSPQPHNPYADFSVNVSAIQSIEENAISLSRVRPVFPKNCAKIFLGLPVYSENGGFLGNVSDLEIVDFSIAHLYTDKGNAYPISSVCAVSDAVILRKAQPYPIGQRIPAPTIFRILDKNEQIVTRSVLRDAIVKSSLIKLTLSLAPFHCDLLSAGKK